MKHKFKTFLGAAAIALTAVSGIAMTSSKAQAQSQQEALLLGTFRDWQAYTAMTNSGRVCYVMSSPKRRLPESLRRGDGFLFVTSRPDAGVSREVSAIVGFPTDDTRVSTMVVDGSTNIASVTKNGSVWVRDQAQESTAVRAFLGGSEMRLTVRSGRGNESTDVYSLMGFTAALERAERECN